MFWNRSGLLNQIDQPIYRVLPIFILSAETFGLDNQGTVSGNSLSREMNQAFANIIR